MWGISVVRPHEMPSESVPKYTVAVELLDRAIEVYLRGDSYYAALHLGGAAEELLAVYAREVSISPTENLRPAFDQMKEAIVSLGAPSTPREKNARLKWAHDRMSNAKNTVKHKRGPKDRAVSFDSKEEAYDVIDRAISTYFQLFSVMRLPHLPLVEEFDAQRRSERDQ